MSQIKITREALNEIERALDEYTELLASLEHEGTMKPNATQTYLLHSVNFVRWLKGEFEPGARNKT